MASRYSRVHKSESGRRYRYDYESSMLQWVMNGQVVDQIGLNADNWRECPDVWVEKYDYELTEELHFLKKECDEEIERMKKNNPEEYMEWIK